MLAQTYGKHHFTTFDSAITSEINVPVLIGRKYYFTEMHCTHNRKLL